MGEDGGMSRFVSVEELFAGRHFDKEVVVLCVRWYLSFKLSYRDLVSMMSERGISLAQTTILPRRSPKDHFCSDQVDHVENTHCHVARHGERWFLTPAAGS